MSDGTLAREEFLSARLADEGRDYDEELRELADARQRRYDNHEQAPVIESQVAQIVGASQRAFSTEWPAALYAAERMMREDWGFRCEPCGGIWWADFWRNARAYRESAESGPLAICKAIVKTTEVAE